MIGETQVVQDLPLRLAVVEWRRTSFRFFDYRGRIAEQLATEFGSVSFNLPIVAGETPIFAEGIQVAIPDSQRRGVVDGRQIQFQEEFPRDIAQFAVDALRFAKVADGFIPPAMYDRLGVLFVFVSESAIEDERNVDGALSDNWTLDNTALHATKEIDNWVVIGTIRTQFDREKGSIRRILREVSIDQFQTNISLDEALSVDIDAAYDRAQSLRSEMIRIGK